MNLGLLFNTLGALIFDGVPEDTKIVICEDGTRPTDDNVRSMWLYTNKNTNTSQVLIANYSPPPESESIRVLWVRPKTYDGKTPVGF